MPQVYVGIKPLVQSLQTDPLEYCTPDELGLMASLLSMWSTHCAQAGVAPPTWLVARFDAIMKALSPQTPRPT